MIVTYDRHLQSSLAIATYDRQNIFIVQATGQSNFVVGRKKIHRSIFPTNYKHYPLSETAVMMDIHEGSSPKKSNPARSIFDGFFYENWIHGCI